MIVTLQLLEDTVLQIVPEFEYRLVHPVFIDILGLVELTCIKQFLANVTLLTDLNGHSGFNDSEKTSHWNSLPDG
jgi:hypothetical protein